MSLEELKEVLKSKHINSWVKIYKDSSEIQDYLFLLYNSRAKSDKEIFGLFYLVMNDLKEIPTSPCGKQCKFLTYKKGYGNYCKNYVLSLKNESCTECHHQFYKNRTEKTKKTNIEKYGVENISQSHIIKKKKENTCLTKYGQTTNLKTKDTKDKIKKTNIEKYGVEYGLSNKNIRGKIEKTNIEKYGSKTPLQNQEVKDKIKKTCMERYGVKHNLSSAAIRTRINETNIMKYGVSCVLSSDIIKERIKKTNIKKYNVPYPMMNKNIQNKQYETNKLLYGSYTPLKNKNILLKIKETNIEKYGVETYSQSPEWKERIQKNHINSRFNIITKNLNEAYTELFDSDDLMFVKNTDFMPYYCDYCNDVFYHKHKQNMIKCPCQKKSGVSIQEKDLLEYIRSLIPDVEVLTNVRDVIAPKELDIYIPSLNLAFEYNGMYWHSTEHKEKRYHQEKVLSCLEKGINLIHIFEDEWNDEEKCNIIKNRIMSKINSTEKIYARKCSVRSVHKEVSDKFVNENHIQGSTIANIHLGLYFNEILVAIMTFGKSRFDKNIEYELIRYCSTGTIVGGASKLLKEFERNYNPKSLVSYADMNWSNGNLYEKIGFINEGHTECGYFYYDPELKIRISRQRCQKHKLVKAGHDPNLTETQICSDILGYYRIYDSGNWKFTKRY